ncbi:MAG: pantoate--beta-alanine ligase [Parvibaculales bacterium]
MLTSLTTAMAVRQLRKGVMMQAISDIDNLRSVVAAWKKDGCQVGLVPTMGALHDGHLSLIEHLQPHCDRLIVSIFVNPTQFAPDEDFDSYPRTLESDLMKIEATATDLVYTPSAATMYGDGHTTRIVMDGPALGLESEARPHFFSGVATIVHKLFQQTSADCAVFGEKDYQQLCVIRQMVKDMALPVEIFGGPTLREADGLAMSSRNVYLNETQRHTAGKLNNILTKFCQSIASVDDYKKKTDKAINEILTAGFDGVDYLEVRAADTLSPVTDTSMQRRALVVARLGGVRLLDNMAVPPL